MNKEKGRYFSVRFSVSLLERLEFARIVMFGERTSLAETIRRLLEDHLRQLPRPAAPDQTSNTPPVCWQDSLLPSAQLTETAVDALLSPSFMAMSSRPAPECRVALRSLSRELIRLGIAIERLSEQNEPLNSSDGRHVRGAN
jgi:hypothetical protein